MTDFRPSGFPPRRGLTRTAPFRVGLATFFLACPALRLCGPGVYYGIDSIQFGPGGRLYSSTPGSVCYHTRCFAVLQANSSCISVFRRKMRKFLCFETCFHEVTAMKTGKITAKLKDVVPVCFMVNSEERKRHAPLSLRAAWRRADFRADFRAFLAD